MTIEADRGTHNRQALLPPASGKTRCPPGYRARADCPADPCVLPEEPRVAHPGGRVGAEGFIRATGGRTAARP